MRIRRARHATARAAKEVRGTDFSATDAARERPRKGAFSYILSLWFAGVVMIDAPFAA